MCIGQSAGQLLHIVGLLVCCESSAQLRDLKLHSGNNLVYHQTFSGGCDLFKNSAYYIMVLVLDYCRKDEMQKSKRGSPL